jgi:hypothetical protein
LGEKQMSRKYLGFDLETAKLLPGLAEDLKAHRPRRPERRALPLRYTPTEIVF